MCKLNAPLVFCVEEAGSYLVSSVRIIQAFQLLWWEMRQICEVTTAHPKAPERGLIGTRTGAHFSKDSTVWGVCAALLLGCSCNANRKPENFLKLKYCMNLSIELIGVRILYAIYLFSPIERSRCKPWEVLLSRYWGPCNVLLSSFESKHSWGRFFFLLNLILSEKI